MDGENLMLLFHRPPVETKAQLDIYLGWATNGALARFNIPEDGGSVLIVMGRADSASRGTLRPSDAGTLKLELHNKQKGQTEVVLTRDADAPAPVPQQAEARELFAMWKLTANLGGKIPGTFIGKLATQVRAYVKAKPNLDSAMKLPKLLPRFVTSREWTEAETIKLLDDVAYYPTEPIAALVAANKLPSSPLWRTEVEFQDIPVKIEKWSEPLRGLRIGMRVTGGEWRIGSEARAELWLHNAGEKDVKFQYCARRDIGLRVFMKGADGKEHEADIAQYDSYPVFSRALLPAGHAFKAKEFSVVLLPPGGRGGSHRARVSRHGKMQGLHCTRGRRLCCEVIRQAAVFPRRRVPSGVSSM